MNLLLIILQIQEDESNIPFIIMFGIIFAIMYYFFIARPKKLQSEKDSPVQTFEMFKQSEISDNSFERCPFCNNSISKGDAFCVHCGNKLPEINENAETTNTKICPKCKSSIGEKDLFCCNCGEAM